MALITPDCGYPGARRRTQPRIRCGCRTGRTGPGGDRGTGGTVRSHACGVRQRQDHTYVRGSRLSCMMMMYAYTIHWARRSLFSARNFRGCTRTLRGRPPPPPPSPCPGVQTESGLPMMSMQSGAMPGSRPGRTGAQACPVDAARARSAHPPPAGSPGSGAGYARPLTMERAAAAI